MSYNNEDKNEVLKKITAILLPIDSSQNKDLIKRKNDLITILIEKLNNISVTNEEKLALVHGFCARHLKGELQSEVLRKFNESFPELKFELNQGSALFASLEPLSEKSEKVILEVLDKTTHLEFGQLSQANETATANTRRRNNKLNDLQDTPSTNTSRDEEFGIASATFPNYQVEPMALNFAETPEIDNYTTQITLDAEVTPKAKVKPNDSQNTPNTNAASDEEFETGKPFSFKTYQAEPVNFNSATPPEGDTPKVTSENKVTPEAEVKPMEFLTLQDVEKLAQDALKKDYKASYVTTDNEVNLSVTRKTRFSDYFMHNKLKNGAAFQAAQIRDAMQNLIKKSNSKWDKNEEGQFILRVPSKERFKEDFNSLHTNQLHNNSNNYVKLIFANSIKEDYQNKQPKFKFSTLFQKSKAQKNQQNTDKQIEEIDKKINEFKKESINLYNQIMSDEHNSDRDTLIDNFRTLMGNAKNYLDSVQTTSKTLKNVCNEKSKQFDVIIRQRLTDNVTKQAKP